MELVVRLGDDVGYVTIGVTKMPDMPWQDVCTMEDDDGVESTRVCAVGPREYNPTTGTEWFNGVSTRAAPGRVRSWVAGDVLSVEYNPKKKAIGVRKNFGRPTFIFVGQVDPLSQSVYVRRMFAEPNCSYNAVTLD
jgi:hypothetical protein